MYYDLKTNLKRKKTWDNRGIYRSSFFVEMEFIIFITVVLDIQKDQTALRVLDSHMVHR